MGKKDEWMSEWLREAFAARTMQTVGKESLAGLHRQNVSRLVHV